MHKKEWNDIFNAVSGGICLISNDETETLLYANRELLAMYECTSETEFFSLCRKTLRGMMEERDYISLFQKQGMSESFSNLSFGYKNNKGHFRHAEGPAKLSDVEGLGKVWIVQLFRSEDLHQTLHADSLTGLPEMHDFFEQAKEDASQNLADGSSASYCPVCFNISNFKAYNHKFGLQAGDQLLRKTAAILRRHFPDELIGHITADRFNALLKYKNLEPRIEAFCQEINRMIHVPGIEMKAGIVYPKAGEDLNSLMHHFDYAKIACDTIRTDATRSYIVYTESMGRAVDMRLYILNNFDKAIENRYIKTYLQPVIRTLTEEVCGFEALARWEDPSHGTIPPNIFIPILEDARLISRLDSYVVNRAAEMIRARLNTGMPAIPISVNFSRLDLDIMNPVSMVMQAVRSHKIPAHLIRVEITETVMAWNRENLKSLIDQFHDAGIEVWLDDFGSEYSSLNTLHNFHFDELKIDMEFFRNFDDRSRKIIKSVIMMAETLGIHTLAEGVETEEQLDFLRNVGCGKIQGYYYGRPLPLEECLTHLSEHHLRFETPEMTRLYDASEEIIIAADRPAVIFQCRDYCRHIRLINGNEAFFNELRSTGKSDLSRVNSYLSNLGSTLRNKLLSYMHTVNKADGKTCTLFYTDNGTYIQLKAKKISGTEELWLGAASIRNISKSSGYLETRRLDHIYREFLPMYDGVYIINREKDIIEIRECSHPDVQVDKPFINIRESFRWYAEEMVHSNDRRRFLDFIDVRNLERAIKASPRKYASCVFRVRREDGNYRWTVFEALLMHNSPERNILLVEREDLWDTSPERNLVLPELLASYGLSEKSMPEADSLEHSLLQSILNESDLKLFWKDKNRRFLGANRALLDYFGISDVREIRGKTDEDLGWIINRLPYRHAEDKVLNTGRMISRLPGESIIDGIPHQIHTTGFPMYRNNQLIGYAGIIQTPAEAESNEENAFLDEETGLLNFHGVIAAMLQYHENFQRTSEDYSCILLNVAEYPRLLRTYGESFRKALVHHIGKTLHENLKPNIIAAHLSGCTFMLCGKNCDSGWLRKTIEDLAEDIRNTHSIAGFTCSMHMQYVIGYGSETESIHSILELLSERLKDAEQQNFGKAVFTADRIILERSALDSSPEYIVISDPKTNDLLYINDAVRKDLHLPDDFQCTGKKCYEIIEDCPQPCPFCANSLLQHKRFHTCLHRSHSSGEDLLMRNILIPWKGKACKLTIAFNLSRYINLSSDNNRLVYHEAAANDAIAVALEEKDPEIGVRKMMQQIARNLNSTRMFIFEENDDLTVSCSYEWAKEGQMHLKEELQGIPIHSLRALYREFSEHHVALIEDYPDFIKENPDFHLPIANIRNLVSGQLAISGNRLGFTVVVNSSEETFRLAYQLLSTLTDFIAILLRNRNTLQALNQQSCRDPLTDALNRRGLNQFLDSWNGEGTFALISGDINGLKTTNDTLGHQAGDELIQAAVRLFRKFADRDHIFRTGGDEFLIIVEQADEQSTEMLVRSMREEMHTAGLSVALGWVIQKGPITNRDALMTAADRRMYADKGQTYRRRYTDRTMNAYRSPGIRTDNMADKEEIE
jgi:diguanylate cyclase (GGDEF)-like protein